MRLADQANHNGALLHGLAGIFDLEQSALRRAGEVLERGPSNLYKHAGLTR